MLEYPITLTDTPAPEDIDVVKQGLDSYDAIQGATVDWVPLALFARDADGLIVAGLTGSTYWGYLYVGRLWTDERFRRQGLGSRLLAAAEQEALRRPGCGGSLRGLGSAILPVARFRGHLYQRLLGEVL